LIGKLKEWSAERRLQVRTLFFKLDRLDHVTSLPVLKILSLLDLELSQEWEFLWS
jgi:hypothetical protein